MRKNFSIAAFALLTAFFANGQEQSQNLPFRNPALPTEKRIDDLLGRLTLDEKIMQMMDKTPAI